MRSSTARGARNALATTTIGSPSSSPTMRRARRAEMPNASSTSRVNASTLCAERRGLEPADDLAACAPASPRGDAGPTYSRLTRMCWRSALLAAKNSSRSSEACGPAAAGRSTACGCGRREPHRDDGGMGRAALHHDEFEIGGGEAGRMPQDRPGDVDDVARQAQDDGPRGGRVERQPFGHRGACRHVGRVDQPQRQLGVVALIVRRMRRLLQIEVGQDP